MPSVRQESQVEEKEREEKYTSQTNELFCEIGRFSVRFEHVCFALRQGITFLLHKGGLRNQQLAHIVLAELTAAPLKSILQAMIAEVADLDETDRLISNKIFIRVQNLIEKRNDVIHSTWFVGWASSEDSEFSQADGHKLSRGKAGAGVKGFKFTAQDFMALSEECTAVEKMVSRLWSLLMLSDRKISDNFVLHGGEVCLPPNV